MLASTETHREPIRERRRKTNANPEMGHVGKLQSWRKVG
jgi:hypothetical protein